MVYLFDEDEDVVGGDDFGGDEDMDVDMGDDEEGEDEDLE